jgi:hypothetical protein
VVPRLLCG